MAMSLMVTASGWSFLAALPTLGGDPVTGEAMEMVVEEAEEDLAEGGSLEEASLEATSCWCLVFHQLAPGKT